MGRKDLSLKFGPLWAPLSMGPPQTAALQGSVTSQERYWPGKLAGSALRPGDPAQGFCVLGTIQICKT